VPELEPKGFLMANLSDVLTDPLKKDQIVDECCALLDAEVGDRGGISGFAIKAGYGAVKGIRPGFVRHVVSDLLPEFASGISPMIDEALAKTTPVGKYLEQNSSRVADALLAITDAKAARAKNAVVKGAYDKLRGMAKKNVEAAVPRLGKLVEKHTSS
jgi:hypothetical protein